MEIHKISEMTIEQLWKYHGKECLCLDLDGNKHFGELDLYQPTGGRLSITIVGIGYSKDELVSFIVVEDFFDK